MHSKYHDISEFFVRIWRRQTSAIFLQHIQLCKRPFPPPTSNNKNKATLTHFQHSLDTSAWSQSKVKVNSFFFHTIGTFSHSLLNDPSVNLETLQYRIQTSSNHSQHFVFLYTKRNGESVNIQYYLSVKIILCDLGS